MNNKKWSSYLNHYFKEFGCFHPLFNCNEIRYIQNKAYFDSKIKHINFNQFKCILKLVDLNIKGGY